MLEYEELSGRLIAAAIQVHKVLGPGFLETIYENVLAIELKKQGINFTQQQVLDIFYDGQRIGQHRLDLFIENIIVLELKSVKEIRNEHFAVVRSYLKALNKKHGMIINFAKPRLEVKRVINPHFDQECRNKG